MITKLTLDRTSLLLSKLNEDPFKQAFHIGEFRVPGESFAKMIRVVVKRMDDTGSSVAASTQFEVIFPDEETQDSDDSIQKLRNMVSDV